MIKRFVSNYYQLGAYILLVVVLVLVVNLNKNERNARIDQVTASYCLGQQERLDLIRDVVLISAEPAQPPIAEQVDLTQLSPEVRDTVIGIFLALQGQGEAKQRKILEAIDAADTCPGVSEEVELHLPPVDNSTER